MTATPIPRTLSLTAYGDLDATTLRELPAGRRPVKTWAVGEEKRPGAYEFIRERLREGRQAFVVCPLVEGSEKLEAKAAAEEAERLRERRVRGLRGRPAARPDAVARQGGGDGARSPAGRTRRARRDHRDRGRDRRPERDRDAGRGRRALRALPAPPAARAGRPRRARVVLHPLRRRAIGARRGGGSRRSRPSATASSSPRSTWRCAARARSSERCQSGLPRFRVAVLPDDIELLLDARREVASAARRARLARRAGAGPAARRRRAAASATSARSDRGVMRVVGGELGGRRLASPPRRRQDVRPTVGARPRGDLLDPRRRGRGRRGPRPLLRHRSARHRGALARGRARRCSSTATRGWRAGTSQDLGLGGRGREVVRADALGYLRRAPRPVRPDLLRSAL